LDTTYVKNVPLNKGQINITGLNSRLELSDKLSEVENTNFTEESKESKAVLDGNNTVDNVVVKPVVTTEIDTHHNGPEISAKIITQSKVFEDTENDSKFQGDKLKVWKEKYTLWEDTYSQTLVQAENDIKRLNEGKETIVEKSIVNQDANIKGSEVQRKEEEAFKVEIVEESFKLVTSFVSHQVISLPHQVSSDFITFVAHKAKNISLNQSELPSMSSHMIRSPYIQNNREISSVSHKIRNYDTDNHKLQNIEKSYTCITSLVSHILFNLSYQGPSDLISFVSHKTRSFSLKQNDLTSISSHIIKSVNIKNNPEISSASHTIKQFSSEPYGVSISAHKISKELEYEYESEESTKIEQIDKGKDETRTMFSELQEKDKPISKLQTVEENYKYISSFVSHQISSLLKHIPVDFISFVNHKTKNISVDSSDLQSMSSHMIKSTNITHNPEISSTSHIAKKWFGSKIMIAGDWSHWIPMPCQVFCRNLYILISLMYFKQVHQNGILSVNLSLPFSVYQYKFFQNGIWFIDSSRPTVKNDYGTLNNILEVYNEIQTNC